MTTPPPPQAKAGWYPDPSGVGQRYWNGNAWLDPEPPQPKQNPTPVNETKTTKKIRCFKCQHVQVVRADVADYTCEKCGQKLKKRQETMNPDPAQLKTASAREPDADEDELMRADADELMLWLRTYGGPAGLLALGALLLFIALVSKVDSAGPAILCLGAGVFWLYRIRSANLERPVTFSTTPQPDQVRQHALQEHLSQYIAVTRGRVESVTPYSAVVVHGQKVNHVLHLLISVLLCGIWLPVWLVIALTGGEKRRVISVDVCGNVTTTR